MTRLATFLVLVLAAPLSLWGCQDKSGGDGPSNYKPPPVEKPPPAPTVDRSCTSAADCEAVACECSCSGGEGVSLREDAVLKKDADRWYAERGCQKPTTCPKVTCPPSRVGCVGGACHVVYGPAAGGP
ncbi:MAG TPA: hypothetical protein VGK67_31720 [Myxococcales bacterium]|jgi:hypothetical protein